MGRGGAKLAQPSLMPVQLKLNQSKQIKANIMLVSFMLKIKLFNVYLSNNVRYLDKEGALFHKFLDLVPLPDGKAMT